MEDINYLMIISTQTYWSLRINNVNPCDTAMLPHHQSIRELCTGRSYSRWFPSLTFPLTFPEALQGVPVFWAWAALFSLYGPCYRPFSAPNSRFQFGLPMGCAHEHGFNKNFTTYWAPNLHTIMNICHWLSHKHLELNMSKTEFSNWAV